MNQIPKNNTTNKTMIIGLGNPGSQYLLTPHNIGWIVIDALAQNCEVQLKEKKLFLIQTTVIENHSVILLKPLTYMNLSGKAVKTAMDYYHLKLDQLLIIHDDLDLPFLSMKFQKNRSPAGHNGLRSINQELSSQNYTRLRIGVSHPSPPPASAPSLTAPSSINQNLWPPFTTTLPRPAPSTRDNKASHAKNKNSHQVLRTFTKKEQQLLPDFLCHTISAIQYFIKEGLEKSANRYNTKNKMPPL